MQERPSPAHSQGCFSQHDTARQCHDIQMPLASAPRLDCVAICSSCTVCGAPCTLNRPAVPCSHCQMLCYFLWCVVLGWRGACVRAFAVSVRFDAAGRAALGRQCTRRQLAQGLTAGAFAMEGVVGSGCAAWRCCPAKGSWARHYRAIMKLPCVTPGNVKRRPIPTCKSCHMSLL